jgi:hypothetical protein
MSTNIRKKEIKVQRAAQSLDHFKNKVAGGEDIYVGILKPVLAGAGILVVALAAWAGFANMHSKAVERHEVVMAEIVRYVAGDGTAPAPAAEVEKRMREKLPVLENLARTAPSSERQVAEGLLASWRLMLGGAADGGAANGVAAAAGDIPDPKDPWQRLRLAQRSLALGHADEASRFLAPLRKGAAPQEPWGRLYWTVQLDCDRLVSNREQALKDLAEYKERFKNLPEVNALDTVVKGI